MKFEDIPKLTSKGSHEVHVSIRDLRERVERYIEEGLDLNPDFQRGHVWTEEQQIKYIEYLLKGGQNSNVISFNHPNWMGTWEGDFLIVDGLQRLTACMKFLKNEIKVFGHYFNEFEGRIHSNIGLIFNINNLKTRKEVLQYYIDFNAGGTVHSTEEIQRVKLLLNKEK